MSVFLILRSYCSEGGVLRATLKGEKEREAGETQEQGEDGDREGQV